MPHDPEVELSVLADQADPLRGKPHARVESDHFYDRRNARVFAAVESSPTKLLSPEDAAYLANAVQYAFPIVAGTYETFFDLAARRRRLLELEVERLELLGVA
jgi:hypothetical protein